MKRTLSKGEGTNFYVNDTSYTRGTLLVDWFPVKESVRLRFPNTLKEKINISPYYDYIDGATGQPFQSFAQLRAWIKANLNAVETPETADSGNVTSSNVKITNAAGDPVPTTIENVPHVIVDNHPQEFKVNNTDPISVEISNPSGHQESIEVSNLVAALTENILQVMFTNGIEIMPGQSIDVTNVVKTVIESMPDIKISSMPNVNIGNVIHAMIDNFPAGFRVIVDNPTPATTEVKVNNTSAIPVSISSVIHAIIDTLPAMVLAPNQSINIGNVIHAIIDTIPAISLASGSEIKINNTSPIPVSSAGKGSVVSKTVSLAGTNTKVIKASKGSIFFIFATNTTALGGIRYLKIFDKASLPIMGTDIPVMTFPIPNGVGSPLNISVPEGIPFANGISIAITGGILDLDISAILANEVIVTMVAG